MNISGRPVAALLRSTAGVPSNLAIIHDSLSHKPRTISPKFGGSANGHNGVRSVITALGGDTDFHRLRIGIGRNNADAADYVLSALPADERLFWSSQGDGVELAWKELSTIIGRRLRI